MYSQPHALLYWGGRIGPTARQDVWSGSIRLGQPGNWSAGELPPSDPKQFPPQLREDLLSALRVLLTSQEMRLRSDCTVDVVKMNNIGRDGKYSSQVNTTQWDTTGIGGSAAPAYPQQIAVASTYRTAARRGRANRGRTYWPSAIGYDATTGGLTETARQGMAVVIGGFLQEVAASCYRAGFALQPCVMSNIGEGTTRRITRVEIGSRFDVQRRRDNDDREVYTGVNVAPPAGYVDPVQEEPGAVEIPNP